MYVYLCFLMISKSDLVFLAKALVASNSADVSCSLLSTPSNLYRQIIHITCIIIPSCLTSPLPSYWELLSSAVWTEYVWPLNSTHQQNFLFHYTQSTTAEYSYSYYVQYIIIVILTSVSLSSKLSYSNTILDSLSYSNLAPYVHVWKH